jgi:hypothetical protein
MTRFLSEALGAQEPAFSQSIQQLEHAAGRPSADIRLTTEITQAMRRKISELGLDPIDTTGPELYRALQERLRADDEKVRAVLDIPEGSDAADVVQRIQKYIEKHDMPKKVFALKSSAAKRLLKKTMPKNAMKRLGYRSADSMLKHETVAAIYAAAVIAEPRNWQRTFKDQYAKLSPSDFEMRNITVCYPATKRWQAMGEEYVSSVRHNMLSFPEIGAIVLLPVPQSVDGLAITTLLLILEEMNSLRAHSSYAKLQQVKPDFGKRLQQSSTAEPYTSATLAGQPVPWRMIQRYYARFIHAYHPEVFEPHVQPEDLQWHAGEDVLASLEPSLEFWRDTQCLGILHDRQIVSCNILDVALGYCNHLPFTDRIVHFVRDNLWHELMMRYLNQENLERAVHQQLLKELADPMVFAEQEAYNEA